MYLPLRLLTGLGRREEAGFARFPRPSRRPLRSAGIVSFPPIRQVLVWGALPEDALRLLKFNSDLPTSHSPKLEVRLDAWMARNPDIRLPNSGSWKSELDYQPREVGSQKLEVEYGLPTADFGKLKLEV